jgi:putative Holliday junction resolvase
MNRRLLAVDLGDRRTGIAVGDEASGTAMPLTVLELPRGDELLQALVRLVQTHAPDAIVMGLPMNMDDTEGPRAALTRSFASTLSDATACPVHMHDERLTSFEAEQRMRGTSRRQKKERSDAIAACVLLESFLADGSTDG